MAVAAARLGTWCADLKTNKVVTRQFGGPVTALSGVAIPTVITLAEFMELVHEEDRAQVSAALQVAIEGKADYAVDFRFVSPDGAIRWVHARGEVVRDSAGVPLSLVGVDMDITERKVLEAERKLLEARVQHAQRLESLGVLAGGIAHDFNNLLVGVLGNADLALAELPPLSPARDRIQDIKTAGVRAAELTRQMLAYSGKGRFVVEAIDLNALVREMSKLIQLAISKHCVLRYELKDDLPPIEADASQIGQVVMNLITNASEAIGERNGMVTLCTGFVDADARYLLE